MQPVSRDYGRFYRPGEINMVRPNPLMTEIKVDAMDITSPSKKKRSPKKMIYGNSSPIKKMSSRNNNIAIIEPIGLHNQGNTCYLNSVMQLLANLTNFTKIVTDETISMVKQKQTAGKFYAGSRNLDLPITSGVAQLLRGLKTDDSNQDKYVNVIRKELNNPEYANCEQHDAQEFLKCLLYAIHIEINLVLVPTSFHENKRDITEKNIVNYYMMWSEDQLRRETSLINDNFTGDLITELRCLHCGFKKYSFEKFGELVLDLGSGSQSSNGMGKSQAYGRKDTNTHNVPHGTISNRSIQRYNKFGETDGPKDLEDLIQNYFREEEVDDFNCGSCKKRGIHIKKCRIWSFPKTLFIYIKRFEYYPVMKKLKDKVKLENQKIRLTGYRQKIVDIEHDLKLRKSLAGKSGSTGDYNIHGYVEHYGEINCGHYIAYAVNERDSKWWRYDDSKVHRMDSITQLDPFSKGSSEIYVLALQITPNSL